MRPLRLPHPDEGPAAMVDHLESREYTLGGDGSGRDACFPTQPPLSASSKNEASTSYSSGRSIVSR
jgi:hypothetical protein